MLEGSVDGELVGKFEGLGDGKVLGIVLLSTYGFVFGVLEEHIWDILLAHLMGLEMMWMVFVQALQ